MREIISLSFGQESNHLQTHFWNFEDEKLKAQGGEEGTVQTEQSQVLYYEQPSTGQMVPRAIMNDFRDNFGNFSACYAIETQNESQAIESNVDRFGNSLEEVKGGNEMWQGNISVSREDPLGLSAFHQELNQFAEDNYQEQESSQPVASLETRTRDRDSDDEEEEQSDFKKQQAKMSDMMRQGKSTMSIFEQMYMQSMKQAMPEQTPQTQEEDPRMAQASTMIDTSDAASENQEKINAAKLKARANAERSLQEYYDDCQFDKGVGSFTDYMQSQFTKQNMFILPSSFGMDENNFNFYNKGKELWKSSGDLRDQLEDKFRHQLERSDMLQGFSVSADVTSGHGSLANMLSTEYIRDEVPKAPILLYAVEKANAYKKTDEIKFNLAKLNKSLWLGEMTQTFDMIIPFNSLFMKQTYPGNPLHTKYVGKMNAAHSIYHRSALQSLVQQAITARNIPPGSSEEFRDSEGRPALSMKDLISSVFYQAKPNIVLPYIQFPLWKKQDERWSENLKIESLCKEDNFLGFNPVTPLRKGDAPLRHSFFFTGMNTLRAAEREAADPLTDHINKLILNKQPFHRGFYSSMRGEPHYLPIPFPRVFTPFALSEDGQILPASTPEQRETSKQKDQFVLSTPSLVKLTQDGAYLARVESAYKELRTMKQVTKMHLLKESSLEEDEVTEVLENLANLVENYKAVAGDSDQSDDDEDMDDDY